MQLHQYHHLIGIYGLQSRAELVLAAHELGMDAIGIADRNSLAGVVRLHSAAKGAGLRPLHRDQVGIARRHDSIMDRRRRRLKPGRITPALTARGNGLILPPVTYV